MTCPKCDVFDVEVAIDGPNRLRSIVAKIQAAVAAGTLHEAVLSDAPWVSPQSPFMELDLGAPFPDVLSYGFQCPSCAQRFSLDAETYHGQGGRWVKVEPGES